MSVPAATNAVTTSASGAIGAATPAAPGADAALFQLLLGQAGGLDSTETVALPAPQGAASAQAANVAPQAGLGLLSLQTENAGPPEADGLTTQSPAIADGAAPKAESGAVIQAAPKTTPQLQEEQQTVLAAAQPTTSQPDAQPIASQVVALQTVQQPAAAKAPIAGVKAGQQDETTDQDASPDTSAEDAPTPAAPAQPATAANVAAAALVSQAIPAANSSAVETGTKTAAHGEEPVESAFGAKPETKKTAMAPVGAKPGNGANAQGNATQAGSRPMTAQPAIEAAASGQSSTTGDSPVSYAGATLGATDTPRAGGLDQAAATPFARSMPSPAAASLTHQIVRRFDGGSTNFQVRLDPPELGRVDVRLTVDKDKRVTAKIGADSIATLTELKGATREIERALSDAGLNLAQDGLSFDLNDQPRSNDNSFEAQTTAAAKEPVLPEPPEPVMARPFGLERWAASGVDVWA